MTAHEELSREIQAIEKKLEQLNAYYDHKVEEILKKGKEKLAKLNQEWEEHIKRVEIERLKKGRAEIEKKVTEHMKKAKQKKQRLLKKKIDKNDLKKVVSWFLKTLE